MAFAKNSKANTGRVKKSAKDKNAAAAAQAKNLTVPEIIARLTEHFVSEDPDTIQNIRAEVLPKTVLDERAKTWMIQQGFDRVKSLEALKTYKLRIFGYGELEDLVNDPDVSDIAIYGPGNVWVKKLGKHVLSDVRLETTNDVNNLINNIAMKLKVNLSAVEARTTKTDRTTNENFILRISIVAQKLTSSNCHNMHIRKVSKTKVDIDTLMERQMLDERIKKYLIEAAKTSPGMIFCGRGAAGKTSLMNALIDEIPQEYSTAIIQENEELFTHKHLATYMWHVDIGAGESRVSYTLEDLARQGLLMDLDYFIIGEVKGPEARYIVTAANTGTTCWCTVHGNDSTEALNKLADYIKSHSDYSNTDIKDIIPFLKSLRVVVFLKNYKVQEISEVVDVDREHGSLIYKPVYNRSLPTPWAEDVI